LMGVFSAIVFSEALIKGVRIAVGAFWAG